MHTSPRHRAGGLLCLLAAALISGCSPSDPPAPRTPGASSPAPSSTSSSASSSAAASPSAPPSPDPEALSAADARALALSLLPDATFSKELLVREAPAVVAGAEALQDPALQICLEGLDPQVIAAGHSSIGDSQSRITTTVYVLTPSSAQELLTRLSSDAYQTCFIQDQLKRSQAEKQGLDLSVVNPAFAEKPGVLLALRATGVQDPMTADETAVYKDTLVLGTGPAVVRVVHSALINPIDISVQQQIYDRFLNSGSG